MEKVIYLFESYNVALKQAFDQAVSEAGTNSEQPEQLAPENFISVLNKAERVWENTADTHLGGLTPSEYIENIEDLNRLLEIFRAGAQICDDKLPDIVSQKLKSFGSDAEAAFHQIIAAPFDVQNDLELLPVIMAVELLGDWKSAGSADLLLDLVCQAQVEDTSDEEADIQGEVVVEYAEIALENIGQPAIMAVLKRLAKTDYSQAALDRMYSVLANAGKENKSEIIYKTLKEFFRNSDDKAYAASLLGIYGDGRAVTALKSYVDRNIDDISPLEFYEIKLAVEELGGTMDDVKLPDEWNFEV